MNRPRKVLFLTLAVISILGPALIGCQSPSEKPPSATKGSSTVSGGPASTSPTPAASGKQLDPEQQKFIQREQDSSTVQDTGSAQAK